MKHRKQTFKEHTRIVDTIQKLHRACTNNAPNMHKKSGRKCRQGKKRKFLVERRGKNITECTKYKKICLLKSCHKEIKSIPLIPYIIHTLYVSSLDV